MASRGKNINLYLMDGEASGRIKCTLANWTGVAYRIPRTELDKKANGLTSWKTHDGKTLKSLETN